MLACRVNKDNKMIRKDQIKGPVLIPFSLFLFLGLGAILFIAYQHEKEEREYNLLADMQRVERLFYTQVDIDASRLHAVLYPISIDPRLKHSLVNNKHDDLLNETSALFQHLSDHDMISHFAVMDKSHRVVISLQKPKTQGNIINRSLRSQAEPSISATQGVELGPAGTLDVRVIQPWHDAGNLIGYLEMGEEIGRVSAVIKKSLGIDLVVRVDERLLHPEQLQNANQNQSNLVVYNSTLDDEVTALVTSNAALTEYDHRLKNGETQTLYTAAFPLKDASERNIGEIMVVSDLSSIQSEFKLALFDTALFILLSGGVIFVLLYVILSRVEKHFQQQRGVEMQFIRLSKEHQRIVQVEKLSEVGRTISEIAHQINNPLVGVVNMAQLAIREADDPARVRELLDDILQAGKDSHTYLQRMLDFTRVSHSEFKATEIIDLIHDTINLFQQSTEHHPVVITDLPPAPVNVNVDPILIRHALFNLLSNAAQASSHNDEISVTLHLGVNQEHNEGWMLKVIDRGSGLSDEVQKKLFTTFFTTKPRGSGLGLAVVQHVAILHGGTVSAENNPNGGAVFALWIPTNPQILEKAS